MIDALPVFLDKLRPDLESAATQRFFSYLKSHYPELESRYRTFMQKGTDPYYKELQELYQSETRIKFVFGDNQGSGKQRWKE